MIDKSEIIVKCVGKINFREMKILVAAELQQPRKIAENILKRELKLKSS